MPERENWDLLAAEYEVGEHAESFIQSDIGQYVVGCAIEEIKSYHADLETEQDVDKIRQIQAEIAHRKHSLRWIQEAIDRGHVAGEQLQVMNAED